MNDVDPVAVSAASDPIGSSGRPIEVAYRLAPAEYGRAMIEMVQQSVGSVAIGSAFVVMGGWTFLNGDSVSLVLVLFGLAMASGLYCVPFILWAVRRRPDLLLGQHEVRVDGDGVAVTTATTSARQSWATFKRLRELTDVILLDYGTGANAMLPLRVFDADALARFRAFAGDRYTKPTRWGNLVKGAVIGVGLAVVWFLVIVLAVSLTS
jgi:hypothetical protein